MIRVYCVNLQRYVEVEGGTTLLQIVRSLGTDLGFEPICARVNNKTEDLQYPVFGPKDVEFLTADSDSGYRVYVRSLCMMLYKAIYRLYPGARLRLEHSISQGYYCQILDAENVNATDILDEMHKISDADIQFIRHEGRTEEVIKLFENQGLTDKVQLLKTTNDLYSVYYTLGDLADSYYGSLAPSTSHIKVFDLTQYHDGFLLRAFDRKNQANVPEAIKQEKMFGAFTDYVAFNKIVGIKNVGELNRAVDAEHTSDLINVAEALHTKKIARISDIIAERYEKGGARIVLIAGPSSSGKTTTTKRLATQLMTNLLKPVMISLDNYFVNRDQTPRDADGDYDYESLYALDLKQFNDDLNAILRGEEVELPTYSFELGKRLYKGNTVRLDDNSIILIEGIHGLNPELTSAIAEDQKFRIYVSALTTLSIDDHNWVPTTDNRLLRRIIRDFKYRGTSAVETIRRWPSVRRGEEKWIFPYQENADATFNSSLLFELGVMKEYGEDILRRVPSNCPEYATAYRLRKFLSYFRPIPSKAVPPTSLLREFLGGSSFHY
jgi:uridine kinase